MATEEQIREIISTLESLENDPNVPKNIKTKITDIIATLKEKIDISIRINKVFDQLDEIANDANLQPYTRTQIWNIVTILEKNAS